jgi:acyl-coenzyme A thioesterase PaaI-like protein
MTPEGAQLAEGLRAAVPFNTTLGLEYLEITPERAVLRMPDRTEVHNHVAGPHAAAQFGLAEAASGAVILAGFSDQMHRALPLAASAEVVYRRLAMGPVTAEATLGRAREDVVADLDAGTQPRIPVRVVIRTEDGTETTEVTITWALRLTRPS